MRCDVLIIGSGMAGASLAAELAAHRSVVVAEREDAHGYHTTGRSAALWIASYGAAPVRALTAAGRGFFDGPPDGFAGYPLLSPRGCLHIARADQLEALTALAAELTASGVEVRSITGEAARVLVPVLKAEAVAAALIEPAAADIDVNALHTGYLRAAKAAGVEFHLSAGVVGLARGGDLWRATLANGTVIEAAVVVDAAGAWADVVAAMAGAAPLGLSPLRRTALLLDPPPGVETAQWPAVIDVDEQFYFKPEAGKLLASPADETPSEALDAAPDELDIAICVDRLQSAADIPVRRVARAWAGLRTFAPDRIPVFGFDPAVAGFFWFAGQGGYGIQTAPAAARLGAALVMGQSVPADIAALGVTAQTFSPRRFMS
jgi:D-arginine dehydrogenase